MSEQLAPMTFAEMNETLRLMIRESQEQRIKYEQRCAEEDKRRAEYETREAQRRAEDYAKFKESFAAWERQNKETNKKISALGSRIGTMIEHMVAGKGSIVKKFEALGYEISKYGPNQSFVNHKLGIEGEVDILLENDDVSILIEVKMTLEESDVNRHFERLKKYRRYADARNDHRNIIGAIAGAVASDDVLTYARENGLYTIVQSGKAFNIVVPEGFKPKEW